MISLNISKINELTIFQVGKSEFSRKNKKDKSTKIKGNVSKNESIDIGKGEDTISFVFIINNNTDFKKFKRDMDSSRYATLRDKVFGGFKVFIDNFSITSEDSNTGIVTISVEVSVQDVIKDSKLKNPIDGMLKASDELMEDIDFGDLDLEDEIIGAETIDSLNDTLDNIDKGVDTVSNVLEDTKEFTTNPALYIESTLLNNKLIQTANKITNKIQSTVEVGTAIVNGIKGLKNKVKELKNRFKGIYKSFTTTLMFFKDIKKSILETKDQKDTTKISENLNKNNTVDDFKNIKKETLKDTSLITDVSKIDVNFKIYDDSDIQDLTEANGLNLIAKKNKNIILRNYNLFTLSTELEVFANNDLNYRFDTQNQYKAKINKRVEQLKKLDYDISLLSEVLNEFYSNFMSEDYIEIDIKEPLPLLIIVVRFYNSVEMFDIIKEYNNIINIDYVKGKLRLLI